MLLSAYGYILSPSYHQEILKKYIGYRSHVEKTQQNALNPKRIIFYRGSFFQFLLISLSHHALIDGVSEGQFGQVLDQGEDDSRTVIHVVLLTLDQNFLVSRVCAARTLLFSSLRLPLSCLSQAQL